MDTYDKMTIRELQAECKSRGIGSGTSKVKLIAKLTENDGLVTESAPEAPELAPDTNAPEVVVETQYETPVATNVQDIADDPDETYDVGTHKFQKTFSHTGDLTSDKHDKYRQEIRQEVVDKGLQPYGGEYDAYLVRRSHNTLTYEIEVR